MRAGSLLPGRIAGGIAAPSFQLSDLSPYSLPPSRYPSAMAKAKQSYDPHPGVAMMRQWLDTLKEKSGRETDAWKPLGLTQGPGRPNERRQWLNDEHVLATNSPSCLFPDADVRDDLAAAAC